MKLSIIIVTYNSADFIRQCLLSVQKAAAGIDHGIIVIDNQSSDTTRETLDEFTNITVVHNKKNVGFATACNQGISSAESEYVLLVNPDAFLDKNYIESCIQTMENDTRIGSVTGKLLFAKENGTKTNVLFSTGHIFFKTGHSVNRGYGETDTEQYENNTEIFGVSGAAPLYRKKMLEDIKIGSEYFNNDFFLYREDEDLDWRARLRGWKSLYAPHAVGYHIASEIRTSHSLSIKKQKIRNRHLMIFRNLSAVNFIILAHYLLAYEVLSVIRNPVAYLTSALNSLGLFFRLRTLITERQHIQNRRIATSRDIRNALQNVTIKEIVYSFARARVKKKSNNL